VSHIWEFTLNFIILCNWVQKFGHRKWNILTSMVFSLRGVHRFRTGPGRLDRGPKICQTLDRGPDRSGVGPGPDRIGPDRTDSRPVLEQHCTLIELIEVLNFSGSHGWPNFQHNITIHKFTINPQSMNPTNTRTLSNKHMNPNLTTLDQFRKFNQLNYPKSQQNQNIDRNEKLNCTLEFRLESRERAVPQWKERVQIESREGRWESNTPTPVDQIDDRRSTV